MTVLGEALRPLVDSHLVPGLVAAVGHGDDIEVVVLGDQSVGGRPMAQDSLFRIAWDSTRRAHRLGGSKGVVRCASLAAGAPAPLLPQRLMSDRRPQSPRRRIRLIDTGFTGVRSFRTVATS